MMRTTSFRFTMITMVLFVISVFVLSAFVYRATIGDAIGSMEKQIADEIRGLEATYERSGYLALRRTMVLRSSTYRPAQDRPYTKDALYILIDPESRLPPVRDLSQIPPEALQAEGITEFTYERITASARNNILDPDRIEQRYGIGGMRRFYNPQTGRQEAIVFVARDITDLVRIRQAASDVFVRMATVTFILALIVAYLSSRAFLARLDDVNRTAEAITAGDLTKRIPLSGGGDEFDALSRNLNSMLDQIERLMIGMKQVSDNIAHDLRSPLTRIRNRLESAMSDPGTDYREVVEKTVPEVDRLLATFNALLSITRIESGERYGTMKPVDLVALVEEVTELYEPAAQDAGFQLKVDIQPTPQVMGSRELISQALANLLDNAFKYGLSTEAGVEPTIEVKVAPRVGGGALLSVSDNGPGVSPVDRERILNRFVRLEKSRSTHGSGLGLSMVTAIARFHNGQLSVGPGLARRQDTKSIDEPTNYGLGIRIAFPPPPKNLFEMIRAGNTRKPQG